MTHAKPQKSLWIFVLSNVSTFDARCHAVAISMLLRNRRTVQNKESNKSELEINLKYNSGNPVINTIQRVSKPGRRVFSSAESLPKINNGLGIAIVSTPKGVMSDVDARKNNIGGEIICKVF